MVSITLPRELEAWAELEVADGRAQSLDGLVADALAARRQALQHLRAELQKGREGAGIPLDDFLDELDGWIAEDRAAAATS